MAFVHGKNSQVALRDAFGTWRDMTPYASEVTVPGKAGVAETTVFGRGAKTYIGGLLEGQVTMKGFFDPTAQTGPDAILSGLLGQQAGLANGSAYGIGLAQVAQVTVQSNYGQFLFLPAGSGANTNTVIIADVVLTDYSLSAPVSGVVSYTATFNLSGAPQYGQYNGAAALTVRTSRTGATFGPTSTSATTAYTGSDQTGGPYGLQVVRAAYGDVFGQTGSASAGWLGVAGGTSTSTTGLRTGSGQASYVQTTWAPTSPGYSSLMGTTY